MSESILRRLQCCVCVHLSSPQRVPPKIPGVPSLSEKSRDRSLHRTSCFSRSLSVCASLPGCLCVCPSGCLPVLETSRNSYTPPPSLMNSQETMSPTYTIPVSCNSPRPSAVCPSTRPWQVHWGDFVLNPNATTPKPLAPKPPSTLKPTNYGPSSLIV